MSKSKLVNKEINTTLGITIFLMAATFLILIDFFIISREIDHVDVPDTGKKVVEKADNDNNTSVNDKSNVLTEQEALAIGNELFEKVCELYVRGEGRVEENVYYMRNADGSFTAADISVFGNDNHEYTKLVISDIKDLLSEKLFSEFCSKFNIVEYQGEYYKILGARGADMSYKETNLKVVSIDNDMIVFDAISSYYINLDEMVSNPDNAETKDITNTFKISKENSVWKVSEFTMVY